jgi:hypothetical protein
MVMTGGLLQIVANGAGAISIDSRIFKNRVQAGRAESGSWLNPKRL